MANIKSAKKRAKTNEKRRLRNRARKNVIKSNIKKFYKGVEDGNKDEAKEAYNVAAKKLDQAASKNVIHKNKAARKKSQLARALNEM